MSKRESFSFRLGQEDLDGLRSCLLAAQEHGLQRSREWAGKPGPGHSEAASQARVDAERARRLWALLAGVRECECRGWVPVGPVARDELLAFLDGR